MTSNGIKQEGQGKIPKEVKEKALDLLSKLNRTSWDVMKNLKYGNKSDILVYHSVKDYAFWLEEISKKLLEIGREMEYFTYQGTPLEPRPKTNE